MKSHPKLRAAPLLLTVSVIVGMVGWVMYQQRKDERAVQRFHELEHRLEAQATPIHASDGLGQQLYTCTSTTGFIYTAPTEANLRGLCESQR